MSSYPHGGIAAILADGQDVDKAQLRAYLAEVEARIAAAALGPAPLAHLTASDSATLEWTGFDHAAYFSYEIDLFKLLPVVTDDKLYVQVRIGGVWMTAATDYEYVMLRVSGTTIQNRSFQEAGVVIAENVSSNNGVANPSGVTGSIRLIDPLNSAVLGVHKILVDVSYDNISGAGYNMSGHGILRNNSFNKTPIDGIRLKYAGGNIAQGALQVRAHRRS